jgi:hypothetical protein
MKNRLLASILVIGLAFIGFNYLLPEPKNGCVNVYVDFASLEEGKIEKCVPVTGRTTALDILESSGIKIEGTNRWGLAVVCRVNGLPDATREACDVMPPENAFWAFIYKNKTGATNLFPKWGWAQEGVSTVYFNPGDSIGLVFSENGDLKWPN